MTVAGRVPSAGSGRPGRRRPRFRSAEVVEVRRPAARWVEVVLAGDELEGFTVEAPTQHVKLLVPSSGSRAVEVPPPGSDGRPAWSDEHPPVLRTYTPRRWDPVDRRLHLQLFVHQSDGEGAREPAAAPASAWAARAQVGDRVAVAGPGGRVSLDLETRRWVLLADESALPAAGTLLDALPAGATALVRAEVAGSDCRLALGSSAATDVEVDVDVAWLERGADRPGGRLEAAAEEVPVDGGVQVWVAAEATAVRRIRRRLLDRGLPATDLVTRGYWRAGEQDHPDHDYGDD